MPALDLKDCIVIHKRDCQMLKELLPMYDEKIVSMYCRMGIAATIDEIRKAGEEWELRPPKE